MYEAMFMEYLVFLFENVGILINKYTTLDRLERTFENSDKIKEEIIKYTDKYLSSSKNELKIYNYIMKNHKKMFIDDIYGGLLLLNKYQIPKDEFTEEIFDKAEEAMDMEYIYRFHVPRNEPKYVTDEVVESIKTYLHGFNLDNLERYMLDEKIYDNDSYKITEEYIKRTEYNDRIMDLYGVNIDQNNKKTIFLPNIKDDKTMLINIKHLIENSLQNQQELDKSVMLHIPIFYQQLYKILNDHVEYDLYTTSISNKLLEEYKNQPFEEQIEKCKFYTKKI